MSWVEWVVEWVDEKLKAVGLVSLCDRRMRGDMIQTFKILKEVDDVDYKTWFTKVNECHQRTRLAVSVSDEGDVVNSEEEESIYFLVNESNESNQKGVLHDQ